MSCALMVVWLVVVTMGLSGCSLFSKAPDVGEVAKAANPLNWFGGGDGEKESATASESESETETAVGEEGDDKPVAPSMPESATLGTVHMVDLRNDFLLIRSSREVEVKYGTALISLGGNGRQTAELKLSPERKGAFLVADIVKGNPDVGDMVKMVGVGDPEGGGRIVPVDTGTVEVLD